MNNAEGNDRILLALLGHLERDAGSKVLQEAARDVLDGRAGLAEAFSSSVCADALTGGLDGFIAWRDQVDPSEWEAQLGIVGRVYSTGETSDD